MKTFNDFGVLVDLERRSLIIFLFSSVFNPVFWNIIARLEYKTHFLSRLAGSKYTGCYLLAVIIFSLGIIRDYLFKISLEEQPKWPLLEAYSTQSSAAAVICLIVGNVLVLSSMYKLGVTGTYLGDYFGILMKQRVTSFPFNVMENPMYNGSTLVFLGTALWYKSFAGLLLTAHIWLLYQLALEFEGPFTAKIYQEAATAAAKSSPKRPLRPRTRSRSGTPTRRKAD